ncbi:MAG: CopG family antitoxin [Blastocatellia bacterium]
MAKNKKKKRDPLPEEFKSLEEAGEFWDTHSSADYEDYMQEVHFEVDLKRSVKEVRIADHVLREVRKIAHQQGLAAETLINLWLQEKVAASARQPA